MNYTQALSPNCSSAGQHENEFSLVLHELSDVDMGAGVYVSCPACNESAYLEGVETLADYLKGYALDDIFRLENYGVITWAQAVEVHAAREAVELEEGHASCMKCAGVFAAATETACAWCGAEVVTTPSLRGAYAAGRAQAVQHGDEHTAAKLWMERAGIPNINWDKFGTVAERMYSEFINGWFGRPYGY